MFCLHEGNSWHNHHIVCKSGLLMIKTSQRNINVLGGIWTRDPCVRYGHLEWHCYISNPKRLLPFPLWQADNFKLWDVIQNAFPFFEQIINFTDQRANLWLGKVRDCPAPTLYQCTLKERFSLLYNGHSRVERSTPQVYRHHSTFIMCWSHCNTALEQAHRDLPLMFQKLGYNNIIAIIKYKVGPWFVSTGAR
jgi:hypothetical protein